jgi:hypothetical protein
MTFSWKDRWLETFARRLAQIQLEIPIEHLRMIIALIGAAIVAIELAYLQLVWQLWNTVSWAGVGVIALTGFLNAILVLLCIGLLGQSDVKRGIALIQWFAVINAMMELVGVLISGIWIAQEAQGFLVVTQFFPLYSYNLAGTVSMGWYAHALKRRLG